MFLSPLFVVSLLVLTVVPLLVHPRALLPLGKVANHVQVGEGGAAVLIHRLQFDVVGSPPHGNHSNHLASSASADRSTAVSAHIDA